MDEEAQQVAQVAIIFATLTIRKVCVKNIHRSKTLHLTMEIHNGLIERLVDIIVSMFIMVVGIVQELGIMHLVAST
jgi:diacylglycerol kinase